VRWVEGFKLGEDQARVIVDVPSDGYNGDTPIGGTYGDDVRPGKYRGLELIRINNLRSGSIG
jgi:hypothetical protein